MNDLAAHRARARQAGFTLLELIIAISLLVWLSSMMAQIITGTMRGAETASEELRAPKVANAIFDEIFKDFRYLYYGGLTGDAGFRGTNDSKGGREADKVAFITTRRTRSVGVDDSGRIREEDRKSPLTEVGYALRVNTEFPEWLELWRREDYFVDDKPTDGGHYSLVYDRIREFSLRYYPIPEEANVQEGLEEWDASQRKGVPYAILLRIQFDVVDPTMTPEQQRRHLSDTDPETIYRIILLRGAYSVPWNIATTNTSN